MFKKRLWRVDIIHSMGYQAPSFFVETATLSSSTREVAEKEAIKIAKEKTRLSSFPKSWTIKVVHLENHFFLETPHWSKWVPQGVYSLNSHGVWVRNKTKDNE
jgi:hypothetical protein